jgi:hypothetical protein
MALFSGRTGRRRRVLNEEVLSASSSHVALRAASGRRPADENTPRYSDAASVENHPQVTDFVPRRIRTIGMLFAAGLASTAVLEAIHVYGGRLSAKLGPWATEAVDLPSAGSLATWLSAVLLLVVSVTCLLVYSLRRHKIADYRGRYRIWRTAAAACLLLSVNSVAAVHRLLAATTAYYGLGTALRANSIWWLVVGGVPLSWIAVRLLLDLRESRLATSAFVLSIASYALATVSYLGALAAFQPSTEPAVTVGAMLIGHWFLLIAVVSYARFVVLDAQGLIPVRASKGRSRRDTTRTSQVSQADEEATKMGQRPPSTDDRTDRWHDDERQVPKKNDMRSFRQQLKLSKQTASSSQTQWVDGSEPESSDDEDDGPGLRQRKLTKAERKQLRKQKARDRAA